MKIGLIGLPKSGKTTLFNLLTGSNVATSRYDSGRAELHTGVARVPDHLSWTDAASIPEAFMTAHDALVVQAGVQRDERILIHAAGSGVGLLGGPVLGEGGDEGRAVVSGPGRSGQRGEDPGRLDPHPAHGIAQKGSGEAEAITAASAAPSAHPHFDRRGSRTPWRRPNSSRARSIPT